MPWRYVCEAAEYFKNNGHQVIIASIGDTEGVSKLNNENLLVNNVRKNKTALYSDIKRLIDEYSIDVIFWPTSWRERKHRLETLGKLDKPIIGYFPGGIYTVKDVLYAFRRIGLRASIPYILEAIIPRRRQLSRLRDNGIKDIIALSEWTAQCIRAYGWPENDITVTLPGKDASSNQDNIGLPEAFGAWLNDSIYIVFMGPPTPIRGAYELIEAFDKAADINGTVKLVCLFRSDAGVDQSKMRSFLKTVKHTDRIYVLWESLDRHLLETYISNSYAIALPFVLVPSEIPLALIDAAAYGKPVITTNCGGTGKFVEKYGVTVDLSDPNDFANKIITLIEDKSLHSSKCNQARLCFESHPTWDDMAEAWLSVAQKALS